MKNKIMILGAMLLLVLVTSCREESDALQNYAFNDGLAFEKAQKSFAGKFKVLWKALDQNYGVWDYERSQGVDWDAVYDEFLPKYEALDKRDDVTDDELRKLLDETLAPLHDGHFVAQMQNHLTGTFVAASPSRTRQKERDDYEATQNTTHNLSAYLPAAFGGTGNQILDYKEADTHTSDAGDFGITVKYALFKENIAYLYLDGFNLSPYVVDEYLQELFGQKDAITQFLALGVQQTWKAWYDKVQQLHASGQLKGVIIDLRNNGGGMLDDNQYVLGSMLPSGGFQAGYSRFKRGVGRYDYSPLSPFKLKTLETAHETITEPIVVLANCASVSMAEMTTLSCQSLPNGTFIGKRTHGGVCSLVTDPFVYYQNYAGVIGKMNETPVFLYIPQMVTLTKDKQILEGVGATPDIEVDFNVSLYTTTGRDTQLERALQFITTGN